MTDHGKSFSHLRYFPWQREYEAALVDDRPTEIAKRVTEAEYAIFKRLQELSDGDSLSERQAIEDALKRLLRVKRDKLGFPDWTKQQ